MNTIQLKNALPDVFSEIKDIKSDIWRKDVTFEKGKTYLIKAESGLGKSSLCSYIYGYRGDFSGNIFFDEAEVKNIKRKKWDNIRSKHLSLLFQELRLFPELTALENIRLKNNLTHHKTESEINSMFDRLAKRADNCDTLLLSPRHFSYWLVFLILDEPISHLDDNNAKIITELIHEEVRAQHAGLIVTSIGKDLPMDYSQILSL